MARPERKSLSDRQLEIMDAIWQLREATVADVWQLLSARRKVARNTVQTMMSRLKHQGWLKLRIDGVTHYYSAAQPQRRVTSDLVAQLLKAAFGDSPSRLVMALLDSKRLSPDEAARIRALIDKAERQEP